MKSRLILPLVAALATACTHFTYVEPQTGAVATVTVHTSAPHLNIGVVSYRGNIEAESEGDSIGLLNSGIPGTPSTPDITFKVRADEEFRFSTKIADTNVKGVVPLPGAGIFVSVQGTLCKTHTAFMPEPGKHYLAEHTALLNGGCSMKVSEIGPGGASIPVASVRNLGFCVDPKLDGAAFVGQSGFPTCKYLKS